MSSTNEFEMLIAGTARGLPTSTLRLVDFVGVHDCSEQQMERLLMALCIRLDRRHMSLPTAIRGSEHYKLPLVSLRCLGIVVAKDQSRTTPSLKLSERLTSLWPVIWGWIQLFHSFILNDNDFDLTFRLSAKSVVLSILHMFASYVSLLPVIQGTSGVVALLFELWSLEAKSHDFDPSNQRYKTTPAVLAMNSYFPELSECKLDWQNTSMSAVGGTAMDVASIALTHLRSDTRPARPDIVIVIMDLKMLGYLSFHVPIRNAILSQHSVLEVTKVAVSLSSQTASSHTRDTLVCLSSCFKYILWQLSFGDVWTWTIQSLDGQLLRAILSSEPYQSRLDDQRLLLDISDAITKNLSTRAVTLAAARAVKKVHAHGLEDRFLVAADEPLRQKWLALKELIHEREQLIPWDNDARKNPIKSCNNRKCRSVEETEGSFKRCGGCLSSFYCSSACQKEHWKREHRSYCLHVQSSRQGGALCPWSARDHHFMSLIMDNDLRKRHYELHVTQRDEGLDLVVAELNYTVVPFTMKVGSLTTCPFNDNGEEEIRAKWDGVVAQARSSGGNLVKRCLVPTGETSKLLMEPGNFVCHCDDYLIDDDDAHDDDLLAIELADRHNSPLEDAS